MYGQTHKKRKLGCKMKHLEIQVPDFANGQIGHLLKYAEDV